MEENKSNVFDGLLRAARETHHKSFINTIGNPYAFAAVLAAYSLAHIACSYATYVIGESRK